MTNIVFTIRPPNSFYLAFSGGIDSAVLLHRLRRYRYLDITLLNIHHGDEWSDHELDFTKEISAKYNIPYVVYSICQPPKGKSVEAYWSDERNKIYQSLSKPVLTGHHLDDAVEWYIMSSLQGCSKVMSKTRGNVIRPMLTTDKNTIELYAEERSVEYIKDPSNQDITFNLRNKVRHNLIPHVEDVFPGIRTTVRKLIIKKHMECCE